MILSHNHIWLHAIIYCAQVPQSTYHIRKLSREKTFVVFVTVRSTANIFCESTAMSIGNISMLL